MTRHMQNLPEGLVNAMRAARGIRGLVLVMAMVFLQQVLGWRAGAQTTEGQAPTLAVPLPAEYSVFLGQSTVLGVSVTGTPPLSFQWNFNGEALTNGATQNLSLTNVAFTQAGPYSVTVSNQFGVTTSSNTLLRVMSLPFPALAFGDYQTTNQLADITIPVFYTAQGNETNLTFSFGFDPAVLTNASFYPLTIQTICSCDEMTTGGGFEIIAIPVVGPTVGEVRGGAKPASLVENTQVYLNTTQVSTGRLGVSLVLPSGQTFAPEYSNRIGYLTFKLVEGTTNPFAGRVVFANEPEVIGFLPNSTTPVVPLTTPLLPLWTTGAVGLNRQSGLLEQGLELTNPGNLLSNVRMFASGLGVDSRTNTVRLQNAIGSTVIGETSYALADLGGIGPGETRRYTLEYYASDRSPASVKPTLEFRVVPAATVVPTGTDLTIDNYRFTNGVFLVEFPTRTGYRYYVQYAPVVTGTNTAEFKTALPPVFGTGSYVQWVDNGPPKTDRLPTNGMRLYRLIETR